MATPATLLERVRGCQDLTPAERRVAAFYEDAYPGVALLKLEEVCAAVDVSTATVTRFARKLGYRDFKELRAQVRAEVQIMLDAPLDRLAQARGNGDRQRGQVLVDRFTESVADLRETARRVDEEEFAAIVALIADESRPLLLGAVASGQPLIAHLGMLLKYLRGGVTILDGADRWAHDLAGLSADSVVVGASFDRYPLPVQRLLRYARGQGAATVLITNRRSNPIVAQADHVLFAASHGESPFRTRTGLLFLFEALLDAVTVGLPDSSRAADIEHVFTVMQGYLPNDEHSADGAAFPPPRED